MKLGTKVMGWVAAAAMVLGASSALAAKHSSKKEISGVVNLNAATPQQLDLLPGVGPSAAKRIVEHRSKAPFAKIEDLRKVKGFGAKKFEKLKPHLSVSGPTTVALKQSAGEAKSEPATSAPAQGRRAAPR